MATWRRQLGLGMVLCGLATLAWGAPLSTPTPKPTPPPPPTKRAVATPAKPAKSQPIAIIPQDGFNLRVAEQLDPHYIIVELASPAHNWFAGTFTNLPTDKEVTIGLSMTGNDTQGNKADVSKWDGLMPVITYADPAKYESYEWFQKDDKGRWVSGDPFKQGNAKFAGTGKTPIQTAIPNALAAQFLSKDGAYWQPWREVDAAEAVTGANVFRIKQKFARTTATVAMRVPFTYTYLQHYIRRLKAANIPSVTMAAIGETPGKRQLQLIRVAGDADPDQVDERRTILVIAREHATEHASSHVLLGMLNALVAQRMTQKLPTLDHLTWLFIPIEDPDGSAASTFNRLTDAFCNANSPTTPKEAFIYARYFSDYVTAGSTIDIALTLHNVEATECAHLSCPFVDKQRIDEITELNAAVFRNLPTDTYLTDPEKPGDTGFMHFRLYGWCARQFCTLDAAYEVNDRWPSHRLQHQEVQALGAHISTSLITWLAADAGNHVHDVCVWKMQQRAEERAAYFAAHHRVPDSRTDCEALALGY